MGKKKKKSSGDIKTGEPPVKVVEKSGKNSSGDMTRMEMPKAMILDDGVLKPLDEEAEKKKTRSEERTEYLRRKKMVMKALEPHNRQKIVFMKGTSGFYTCFGTSAIIYHKLVLPRVDKKARIQLRVDSDWSCPSKYGAVSIKRIDVAKHKILTYPGIKLVKENEEFISFELAEPLSEEEFTRLVEKDQISRRELRKKLTRSSPMQNAFTEILEIVRSVDRLERHHTEKRMFELYGLKMNKCVEDIVYHYMRLARKEAEALPTIEAITAAITRADAVLIMIDEVGCWTHDECAEVGESLAKLSRAILTEEKKAREKASRRRAAKDASKDTSAAPKEDASGT